MTKEAEGRKQKAERREKMKARMHEGIPSGMRLSVENATMFFNGIPSGMHPFTTITSAIVGRDKAIHVFNNCQLSIVNCQLSIVNCQLSIVNCQLSIVNYFMLFVFKKKSLITQYK
jgi:hypothetical protein